MISSSIHIQRLVIRLFKILTCGLLGLILALPAETWAAVVVFDNGPFVNSFGTGFGGTDESVVQTSLGMSLFGFNNGEILADRIADDFTLRTRVKIQTIRFYAYQTNSTTTSTITSVNLRIWKGRPDDPNGTVVYGDTTTNRMTGTKWSNIYRVLDTEHGNTDRPIMEIVAAVDITLDPGTYWLDWQMNGAATLSGPWAPPITINGQTTTGNALQYSGSSNSWTSALDTSRPQGFPFSIEGERTGGIAVIPYLLFE